MVFSNDNTLEAITGGILLELQVLDHYLLILTDWDMILLHKPLLTEGNFFVLKMVEIWLCFCLLKNGKLGISEAEKYKLDYVDRIEAITSVKTLSLQQHALNSS